MFTTFCTYINKMVKYSITSYSITGVKNNADAIPLALKMSAEWRTAMKRGWI